MVSEEKKRDMPITGVSNSFPDRHLNEYALTAVDPQHASNGCLFDPHCPECIRELWGPLLSPFAYLIKQNAQYFNEMLTRIDRNEGQVVKQQISSSPPIRSKKKSSVKRPKRQRDDHKFLTSTGSFALKTGKFGWLIVAVIGIGLIGVSSLFLVFKDEWIPPVLTIIRMESASDWGMEFPLKLLAILMGVIGFLQIVTGVAGFYVTTRRMEKLTYGIVILAALLIFAQIGIFIYYIVSRAQISSEISETLENSFQNQYGANDDVGSAVTSAWDRAFQKYRCCGWKDSDFSKTKWPSGSTDIPESCCTPDAATPGCQSTSAGSSMNYVDSSCQNEIEESLNSSQTTIIIFAMAACVIVVQIAIAFATYWYLSALKVAQRRRKRHNRRQKTKSKKKKKKPKKKTKKKKKKSKVKSLPTIPTDDRNPLDDLRQLYNHYTAFHQSPPDLDPGVMSITPTVIQVKRPNVYSYFYYE